MIKYCLRDADLAILVVEPTPASFSDLARVLELVNYFRIPYGVVVNKWDINPNLTNKIKRWSGENTRRTLASRGGNLQGKFLGKISYDKKIFQAIAKLIPIMETNLRAKKEIKKIYKNLILNLTL